MMRLLDYTTTRELLDASPVDVFTCLDGWRVNQPDDVDGLRKLLELSGEANALTERPFECCDALELLALYRFRSRHPDAEPVDALCAAILVAELTTSLSRTSLDGHPKPLWVRQQIMRLLGGDLDDEGWGWAPQWMARNEGMPGLDRQETTGLVLRLLEALFFAPAAQQVLPEIQSAVLAIRLGERERGEQLLDAALVFAGIV